MTLSDNFNAFWVNFNLKMLGDKNVSDWRHSKDAPY